MKQQRKLEEQVKPTKSQHVGFSIWGVPDFFKKTPKLLISKRVDFNVIKV